jgi:hypothetical protein
MATIYASIYNSEFGRLSGCLSAGNRAFRSNSSVLLSQALRDFRYNPWRSGSSEPVPEIAEAIPGHIIAALAIMRT